MKKVTLSEFRRQASGMLTQVERGESLIVLRHGRPIAKVTPVREEVDTLPSWKKPGPRLVIEGEGLSKVILEEREES